jgi:hypothetical protein
MTTPDRPGRPSMVLGDLVEVDHDEEVTDVAVAALALGLSYAGLTGDECAAELAQAHGLELLRDARQHLDDTPHLLPGVVAEARDLLDRAVGRASASRRTPAGGRSDHVAAVAVATTRSPSVAGGLADGPITSPFSSLHRPPNPRT